MSDNEAQSHAGVLADKSAAATQNGETPQPAATIATVSDQLASETLPPGDPTPAPPLIAVAEERALKDFRSELVGLINLTEPKHAEEPPGRRIYQIYKAVVVPWYDSESLEYDQLVAKYIGLWSVLEKPDTQRYSAQALLGLRLLKSGRLKAASQIFWEIEFQTSAPVAIAYVMRGIGYFLRWLLALITVMAYPVFSAFYIFPSLRDNLSIPSLDVFRSNYIRYARECN